MMNDLEVVQRFGYNTGFLTLAAIAAIALAVFWFAMPEIKTLPKTKQAIA
jgi:predicted MFS family arabinose efflux permease